MGPFVTNIRSMLTFILAITYLANNIMLKSNILYDLNLILLSIIIILNFFVVTGTSRVIGYASFLISIVLFIYFDAPLSIWKQALEENLYLVVMFTLVPLLGIPIQYGGYFNALRSIFQKHIHTKGRFYLLVSLISAFIGILVSLAVVPLVNQISRASDFSKNKKLLSSALNRGFTTCVIWAPTTGAIALIIKLTGAEWSRYFPFGLLCGVIAGLTGYVLTMIEENETSEINYVGIDVHFTEQHLRKIFELCIFGICLILSIALISYFTGKSTILVVSLGSLLYPIIWMGIIGRLPILYRKFKYDYYRQSLPKLKSEIILFTGAGLFVSSIKYSHIGDYIPQALGILAGQNAILFAVIVIIASILTSMVGIHPIVPVTIIGGTVSASSFGLSTNYLALILGICYALGLSINPSSAIVIAISGLINQSPIQVGLAWNGRYVIITALVLIVMSSVLRWLGLL